MDDHRSPLLPDEELWTRWTWQRENALRTRSDFEKAFPNLDTEIGALIEAANISTRVAVTPYYAQLAEACAPNGGPSFENPLWAQVLPTASSDTPPGETSDPWLVPHQASTPIATHKFTNRMIVRVANICHAYCQFCFESRRTLEKDSSRHAMTRESWSATLNYLNEHPEIEEIILSGGEPFMLSNARLDSLLGSLREQRDNLVLRIHTRTLTFNPFRFDAECLAILRRHRVTAIGVHVAHAAEISTTFEHFLKGLQQVVPLVFGMTPLLRGVNADEQALRALFSRLYSLGVRPYSLYHFMPHSPGVERFRTTVSEAIGLVQSLRARLSSLAIPNLVLSHPAGKVVVPVGASSQPVSIRTDANGVERVTFHTSAGEAVHYS